MRSHRRRGPLEHVLVAGDLADLEAVSALLAFLPADAYGQVFVETPADAPLAPLPAPARVTVTRIARPLDAEPGRLLARAVDGWVAEWCPGEPDAARAVAMWVGASARDLLDLDPVGTPLERL
jgi:NADPH-dependent ferric siderophore reductase